MHYMIIPLDLKDEEMQIYKLLYKKADFKYMNTKYTLEQLVLDSNPLFNLTKQKIRTIIKNLIDCGYLIELEKGKKGKPTIYNIVKISDINQHEINTNLTRNQHESNTNDVAIATITAGKQHEINTKSTRNQHEINTPINDKDKEKDKDTSLADAVLSYYKEFENLPGILKLTDRRKKTINARIKEYGLDNVKKAIELASESQYLMSKKGQWFNFDWIFTPTYFPKILEGNYKDKDYGNNKVENKANIVYYEDPNPFINKRS